MKMNADAEQLPLHKSDKATTFIWVLCASCNSLTKLYKKLQVFGI